MFIVCICNMAVFKLIPLLCTHIYSYMFSTRHPPSHNGAIKVISRSSSGGHLGVNVIWTKDLSKNNNGHKMTLWMVNTWLFQKKLFGERNHYHVVKMLFIHTLRSKVVETSIKNVLLSMTNKVYMQQQRDNIRGTLLHLRHVSSFLS